MLIEVRQLFKSAVAEMIDEINADRPFTDGHITQNNGSGESILGQATSVISKEAKRAHSAVRC